METVMPILATNGIRIMLSSMNGLRQLEFLQLIRINPIFLFSLIRQATKPRFNYALSSNFTSGEIRVNDVSGKTIAIVPVLNTSTSTNLDCNDFANGIYFVSLIVNNEMIK